MNTLLRGRDLISLADWSVGEIIEALEENYPDAADTISRDVFRTLDILKDEEVITI